MRRLVPIVTAVGPDEYLGNMRASTLRGYPLLKPSRKFKDATLTIACYGPSLIDTWTRVRHPLMTVSGAHDFLINGGIFPDYHVECDPREHKATFTKNAQPGVEYLMASCCHPKVWENVKGKNVTLWHLYGFDETNKWVKEQGEEDSLVGGGSTVGLRALEVAAKIGYRKFAIHGMDCSYGASRHAGGHPNETEREIEVKVNGKPFRTSPQLYEAAREFVELVLRIKADISVTMYGEGLLQELLKTAKQLRRAA
jgi:hypothetical protein